MPTTPAEPLNPGSRPEQWLAHRATPVILTGAILSAALIVAINLTASDTTAWWTAVWALLCSSTIIAAFGWAAVVHHIRMDWGAQRLCAGCSEKIPDNINEEIARKDRYLRADHRMMELFAKLFGRTGVRVVISVGVIHAAPFAAVLMASILSFDVLSTALYVYGVLQTAALMLVRYVHSTLRPWCPYCRPGWPGEGQAEPRPDPTARNQPTT